MERVGINDVVTKPFRRNGGACRSARRGRLGVAVWPTGGQIAAFIIFTALLGVLSTIMPRSPWLAASYCSHMPAGTREASSSADDTLINASIAADIASSGSDSGGRDAGHHGV